MATPINNNKNLKVYLDFDENIADKSDNGTTIIANNGAIYGVDKDGNSGRCICISKDGMHNLVINKSLTGITATISFFMCIDDDSSPGMILDAGALKISKENNESSEYSTCFDFYGSKIWMPDTTPEEISKSKFYNIIINKDISSGISNLYIDNVLKFQSTINSDSGYKDSMAFGGYDPELVLPSFRIDDFKFFDVLLTAEEMAEIVSRGPNYSSSTPVGGSTGSLEKNLKGMWSFNNNLNDSSVNKIDLSGSCSYSKDFQNNPSSSLAAGSLIGLNEKFICNTQNEPFSFTVNFERNSDNSIQYLIGNSAACVIKKNGSLYFNSSSYEQKIDDDSNLLDENFLSVRYDGSKLSCKLNGTEKINKNISINASTDNFSIGCRNKIDCSFLSRIDEVRVYSYSLPDSYENEIRNMGVNFELLDKNPPAFKNLGSESISKRSFSISFVMDEKSSIKYKISKKTEYSSVTYESLKNDYDKILVAYSDEIIKESFIGLDPETEYEVFLLAEDFNGNLQSSLSTLSVKTEPLDKVYTPYSNINSGIYAEAKLVKLFSKTTGAEIKFSVYKKSEEPSVITFSSTYSSPIIIGSGEDNTFIVKAIATHSDMKDSDIFTLEITTRRNSTLKIENSIFPLDVSDIGTSRDFLSTLGYKYSLYDIAKNNPNSYVSFGEVSSGEEIFKISLSDFKYCGITEILRNFIYTNITNSGIDFVQNSIFNSSENLEFFNNEVDMSYKLVIVNDGEDVIIKGNNKVTFVFNNISIISKPSNKFSESKKIVYEGFDGLSGSKFEITNKKTGEMSYVESSSNYLDFPFIPGVYYKVSSEFTKKIKNTSIHIKGDECDVYNSFPDINNVLGVSVEENEYGSFKLRINNQNYKFSDEMVIKLYYSGSEIFSNKVVYPQEELVVNYNKQSVEKCGIITLKVYATKDGIRTTNDTFIFIKVPLNDIVGIPNISINDDYSAEIKNIDLFYDKVKFKILSYDDDKQITEGYLTIVD